jgi:TRAP-type C4-dicarboxylate transport system permease small subunit
MEKAFRLIDILVKIVLIIFTSLMCFIVLWQVISRFILNNPSRWSEEVARYLMIWITFLGASVGVKTASHLGLTIFVKRYKDVRSRLAVTIFSYTCIIIFSLVLVIYGYEYMVEGHDNGNVI